MRSNDQIRFSPIILIDEKGENLGEKSTEQKPEEPKLTEESMVLKNQATPEKLKTETVPNNSVSENI